MYGGGSEKFQCRSSTEFYFTKCVNNKDNFFSDLQKVSKPSSCGTCGGYRYVPCAVCHGSKKSLRRNHFTEEFQTLRCVICDENGLVKCDKCTVRSRTIDTDTRTRGGSWTSQREGRQPQREGCQSVIWPKIPENCMTLKKNWTERGIRHCVSYIVHDLTPINRSMLYN